MAKKGIDRKTAKIAVEEGRRAGKTDQEIYASLTEQYYDKKSVALFITSIPTDAARRKYEMYNYFLMCFIAVGILLKILAVIGMSQEAKAPWLLLFTLAVPIINVYFIYEMWHFNASIYRVCLLLTIGGALRSTNYDQATAANITFLLVYIAIVCGLCYFIDANVFPYYTPRKMKTDTNGDYVLAYPAEVA